jgi:hypothetical protein
MNCAEFGLDRSRGFGSARGKFWPIAIDRPTRPYNIASTTVQQVIGGQQLMDSRVSLAASPQPAMTLILNVILLLIVYFGK